MTKEGDALARAGEAWSIDLGHPNVTFRLMVFCCNGLLGFSVFSETLVHCSCVGAEGGPMLLWS